MKWISSLALALLAFPIPTPTLAVDTVALAWDPYLQPGAAAVRVYWGASNVEPIDPFPPPVQFLSVPPIVVSLIVTNIQPGITKFWATGLLTNGLESLPSNVVYYTNRFFGPVNLRITMGTNQTAALWIEHWPGGTAVVESSPDRLNWTPWASVRSYEGSTLDIRSLFITGLPGQANFWRVTQQPAVVAPLPPPLPAGIKLD